MLERHFFNILQECWKEFSGTSRTCFLCREPVDIALEDFVRICATNIAQGFCYSVRSHLALVQLAIVHDRHKLSGIHSLVSSCAQDNCTQGLHLPGGSMPVTDAGTCGWIKSFLSFAMSAFLCSLVFVNKCRCVCSKIEVTIRLSFPQHLETKSFVRA